MAVWKAGLGALELANRFDIRLADAYVRLVFVHLKERDYPRAASVYLDLLDHLDDALSVEEATLLDRHVAQMVFLLPDALREKAVEGEMDWTPHNCHLKEDWQLRTGASRALVGWPNVSSRSEGPQRPQPGRRPGSAGW